MPSKNMHELPNLLVESIQKRIVVVRNNRVLLDSDLASFYGISTGRLNEAVSRNKERFPDDFMFLLSSDEFQDFESMCEHGGRRTNPRVFTEQGAAMLSAVLKSPTAAAISIQIMRAFVQMRHYFFDNQSLWRVLESHSRRLKGHDDTLENIITILKQWSERLWIPHTSLIKLDFVRKTTLEIAFCDSKFGFFGTEKCESLLISKKRG